MVKNECGQSGHRTLKFTASREWNEQMEGTDCFFLFFFVFFLNWDSLYLGLNSHYEAWNYKKKITKRLKHTGESAQKNLHLKDVCQFQT